MTTANFADDGDWDDPAFLSKLDAVEAESVRRLSQEGSWPSGKRARTEDFEQKDEGDYTAALKGSKSARWEAKERGPGQGHVYGGAGGSSGEPGSVPERLCPCGAGPCTVLTAHTERNMGRKFYRCPRGKEEGCTFFDWCDAAPSGGDPFAAHNVQRGTSSFSGALSATDQSTSQPPLDCPCGAGPCTVLTAKTERNRGRMFYRCPNSQGGCNFFKWSDELTRDRDDHGAAGGSWPRSPPNSSGKQSGYQSSHQTPGAAGYGNYNSLAGSGVAGNSAKCFTWGQTGHWSKDCRSTASFDKGGGSGDSCYKCGQPGHWASNCSKGNSPQKKDSWPPSAPKRGTAGTFNGQDDGVRTTDSCYKCGQQGHWAPNCPQANSPQKKGSWPTSSPKRGTAGSSRGQDNAGRCTDSCYKCGQQGHWASNCPNKNVPQGGQGFNSNFNASKRTAGSFDGQGVRNQFGSGGTSSETCFKCGRAGHWASKCPIKVSPQKASQRWSGSKSSAGSGRGRGCR